MARIKVEDIVDHLDREFRKALENTLEEHFPNENFDARDVFRTFKRKIRRKCNTWENVPDRFVED
ncbi:hypothetical protein [Ekhidna sp.]